MEKSVSTGSMESDMKGLIILFFVATLVAGVSFVVHASTKGLRKLAQSDVIEKDSDLRHLIMLQLRLQNEKRYLPVCPIQPNHWSDIDCA